MHRLLPFLVLLFTSLFTQAAERPLWLACGPAELVKALEPLAELRRQQGMDALLLPLMPEAALAKAPRRPDYLVIVGDEKPGAPWHVPAARVPFSRWNDRQRKDFASDLAWGGLNRDGLPRVAAGRLPARSAEEAALLVGKILEWEKKKPSREMLSLPMWAGDPAYSPAYTAIFMDFLFGQVAKHSPAWLEPWILSGDPRHPLCGWPASQAQLFNERTARGGLFLGMMGHGDHQLFCSVRVNNRWAGFHNSDVRALGGAGVRPPQVIFACECGAFDQRGDSRCLAEELLMAGTGPVLTVAAANDSHPLTNFYTATNFLRLIGETDGPVRFGDLWLRTQRDMRRRTDFFLELALKNVEGSYSKPTDAQELKRDQATLYAIFGDPATSLHIPRKLEVRVEKTAKGWAWEVTPPAGANKLVVEHRTPRHEFAARPADADEKTSLALLTTANEALAFRPIPAEGWRGETARPGILRFSVEGDSGLWVAGAVLP